ncbi:MAG: septum formation initiator family protein [Bacteroidetes bacterium]|nr:septum formation initiator family protein [Bacteroidota bacterium]
MKTAKKLLPYLKNKYILTIIGVVVWIAFFDKYDLVSQYHSRQALKQLEKDKQYYTEEIRKNQEEINELQTNAQSLEKFAREKYLMKKDNEDVFLIIDKSAADSTASN